MSAQQPVILSASEGEKFAAGPFAITSRVLGEKSGGAFEMYELALGAATVDYHVHHLLDETIYVLEGEIEFVVEGEKYARASGSVAFIPRGVRHGFCNHGPASARVLIVFSPSGNQHEYFRALERLFAAPELDVSALRELQARYDQQLVPTGRWFVQHLAGPPRQPL